MSPPVGQVNPRWALLNSYLGLDLEDDDLGA